MDFAAVQAKRRCDGKHRALSFEVGDKVYLRLHHGYHLPGKPSRKYSQQRSGPWVVLRKIQSTGVRITFPPRTAAPVISVAHLSPTPKDDDPFERRAPPPGPVDADQDRNPDSDEGDLYETEVILQHKVDKRGGDTNTWSSGRATATRTIRG